VNAAKSASAWVMKGWVMAGIVRPVLGVSGIFCGVFRSRALVSGAGLGNESVSPFLTLSGCFVSPFLGVCVSARGADAGD
jgi:hypothetical protein